MEHVFNQIVDFINNNLGAASAIVGVAVEFSLRLTKSEKPLSILHTISFVIKKSGEILSGVANFMDKVLPQKLK